MNKKVVYKGTHLMAALDPAERCQFRDGLEKQEHSLIEKSSLFPVPARHYGYTKDSRLSAALEMPPGTVPLLSED